MLVLPRYSICMRLFSLLRSSPTGLLCGLAVILSIAIVVSVVSFARGDDTGPQLIAASAPSPRHSAEPDHSASTVACATALRNAEQVLARVETMQALMEKRERVRGRLEPMQRIELKVRRAPRSVYMRWRSPDEGQEVIWQENANRNQILVHPGGWRGRVMPIVKIDPKSPRVTEQSRRPIESAGLWTLTQQLIEAVDQAQAAGAAVQVSAADGQSFAGCACTRYELVRDAYTAAGDFQRLVIYIDANSRLPVGVERYVWNAGGRGEAVLDEYYAYRELRLNAPLNDRDFSPANPAYRFGADEAEPEVDSIGRKPAAGLK